MVMGTMGYMSPEQVRGRPADSRSDIFSFGAVLYEMLTGQRAFSSASAAETMSAILKEDPLEAEAGIAPPLERIIRHCLEKNPDQRFQSARDIAFALDALSQTSTRAMPAVEERPIEFAPPGMKWLRWALVGGVLVWALTGVLSFFAGARSGQRPPLVFRRLTFRRGEISSARFAPDGNTLVYSAAWEPKISPAVVAGARNGCAVLQCRFLRYA